MENAQALPFPSATLTPAQTGLNQDLPRADKPQARTNLATYLPQVAADAVAKSEDTDPHKVNNLYKGRVKYVANQTLNELREYAGKHGTITGFAYSAVALKFAWAYKRTEDKQKIELPDRTDSDLSDVLNVIYAARQGTDLTLRAMTKALEGLDIHPRAVQDEMIAVIWQAWLLVKAALDNIAHKADLFEMAMTRLGTDIDNLIDLIQNSNDDG